jgi:hypothetical protein
VSHAAFLFFFPAVCSTGQSGRPFPHGDLSFINPYHTLPVACTSPPELPLYAACCWLLLHRGGGRMARGAQTSSSLLRFSLGLVLLYLASGSNHVSSLALACHQSVLALRIEIPLLQYAVCLTSACSLFVVRA